VNNNSNNNSNNDSVGNNGVHGSKISNNVGSGYKGRA